MGISGVVGGAADSADVFLSYIDPAVSVVSAGYFPMRGGIRKEKVRSEPFADSRFCGFRHFVSGVSVHLSDTGKVFGERRLYFSG